MPSSACDEKKLRLHPHVEDVPVGAGLGQDPQQVRPAAIGMRLAVDEQVRGKPGGVRLPGKPRVGRGVDAGQHVVRMRTLPRSPQGRSGETGPDVQHVVEAGCGNHFCLGGAVDIDELHKQKLDPVAIERFPQLGTIVCHVSLSSSSETETSSKLSSIRRDVLRGGVARPVRPIVARRPFFSYESGLLDRMPHPR